MEVIPRHLLNNDWVSGLLLFSLICLVFAKVGFYNRFVNFTILPFNNKYIVLYNKKGRLLSGFHIAFSLFQFINLGLFIYLCRDLLPAWSEAENAWLFLFILAGILGFTLLKIAVQLLGGVIFNAESLVSSVIFKKLSYLNYSALVLFAANLLLTYLLPGSRPVIFISIFLLALINGIGWINILKIHQKFIASHLFYFILYLCALEMAPYLIILSWLNA